MKRTGRRRSSVWDCFEQVGNFVRCMKCDARLKYCGGATSTMMSHVSRYHPPSDEDEKPVICTVQGNEEEEEGEEESAARVALMSPNASATTTADCGERKRLRRSSVWDIFIRVDDEVHCTMCDTKLKYRSSTTSMMYHIKNKHPDTVPADGGGGGAGATHAEVTELISRMIEKDMLPVDVVGGNGFRELLAHTVHNYKMPSAAAITRLIESHFREKVEELVAQLGKVEKLALTADVWTALPSQRYMTVFCSFITEDWQGSTASVIELSWKRRSSEREPHS
ncbi:hypothetical protein EYF80_022781 [Liparis tanakae]|uniref:BED-type domain-containing protein n=1 Tax=Liparis tanakae TaxID=230148 RepID=A0A4Z2HMC9_9TELE|nr:hypothetical protein EYF80_022781 [Liparis tanakae]